MTKPGCEYPRFARTWIARLSKRGASGVLLLAMMPAVVCVQAQTTGTITAEVFDQDGKPLADAWVQIVPVDRAMLSLGFPSCVTDAGGLCSHDLEFGSYHVSAEKEADGYPDLVIPFYSHGKWPATVRLSPEHPTARVVVRLGPRAASLVFNVIDAVTAARIENLSVGLRPFANQNEFLGTNLGADFRALIPADEDVSVEVEAKGYQTWTAPGPVRLASGESKTFTISLHPQ